MLGHLRFLLEPGLEILGVSGCLCSPVGWEALAGAVSIGIQVLLSASCLHSIVFSQSVVSVHAGDSTVRLSHCFSPSFPVPKCRKTLVQFCLFYHMDNTNVSLELLLFLPPAVFPVHNLSIFNLLHSDLFS